MLAHLSPLLDWWNDLLCYQEQVYVMYMKMDSESDFTVWKHIAKVNPRWRVDVVSSLSVCANIVQAYKITLAVITLIGIFILIFFKSGPRATCWKIWSLLAVSVAESAE